MSLEARRGSGAWWVGLVVAGLAFLVTAFALAIAGAAGGDSPVAFAQQPTATYTPVPTNTATPNAGCIPSITKQDNPDEVPEGGEITYTIKVTNDGSTDCTGVEVTDGIPTDTDCVSATVVDDNNIDFDITGCDDSGTVKWEGDSGDELGADEDIELQMVVELTSGAEEGDEIDNEACVTADGEIADVDCDQETTDVGKAPTATPRPPTATPQPTVRPLPTLQPPPPAPVPPGGGVVPTLVAPPTGSGPDGSGWTQPLALALGIAGVCLLVAAGAARLRKAEK